MVSFDVRSLFTNVPIGKVLEVVNKKLTEDDTLVDRTLLPNQVTSLLEICFRTIYFIYQGQYFEQTDGAAMGSPVSPVVANIFMEHVEGAILTSLYIMTRFWRRYVDDTFCFLQKSTVENVLSHLNWIFPSINFTVKKEDKKLPFLDVLMT